MGVGENEGAKSIMDGGAEATDVMDGLWRCEGTERHGIGDSGGGGVANCSGFRKGEGARAGSEEDSNDSASSGGE